MTSRLKTRRFRPALNLALFGIAIQSATALAIESPQNLNGSISAEIATVAWDTVADADGYNVYRNDAYLATVNTNTFTDSVEDGEVYHYYIVAFTDEPDYSVASERLTLPLSAVPTDLTIPPSIPAGLEGDITGTTVSLSWDPSTDDESVAGYNVYRNNEYITTVHDPEYSGVVVEGERYVFSVAAFDIRQNFSQTSDGLFLPQSGTPDPDSPPSVPTNLVGSISGTTVSLSWDASTDNQIVQGYNVYQDNSYITTVATPDYEGTVQAETFYSYSIVAFDNDSNFSANSIALLLPDTGEPRDTTIPPDSVTGLSLEAISSGSDLTEITLTWNSGTDDFGVAGYNVYQNNNYLTTVNHSGNPPGLSVTVGDGTNNNWAIVAFDHDGNFSAISDVVRYPDNGPDITAPTMPGNLTGTHIADGQQALVTINWNASSDDASVLGYNVYQNNAYLTTVYDTSFEHAVDPAETNSYFVVAYDNSNNFSAPSDRINLPDVDNIPPTFAGLEDVTLYAGETLSLVIRPVDADGDAPGLAYEPLPTGMLISDNMDGSSTLHWQVLEPQVGSHSVVLTAMDAADPTLTTTETLIVSVELPDDLSTIPNHPPGINLIEEQFIRAGDRVNMRVKGTDPNGTIPALSLLNPPAGSTFLQDSEDPAFWVLQWTSNANEIGVVDLLFQANDATDNSLITQMSVKLNLRDPADFARTGPRLRDLAEQHDLDIGYAQVLKSYENPDADLYRDIAAEEFNIVTAENSMKWGYINPEPGVYRWDSADDLVSFAAANDMKVRGHTLVWYTVLPAWVMNSDPANRETLMLDFIDSMITRYPDIDVWDVVNEAFEEDGSYRNSVWYQAMGEDYIAKAFVRSREQDADAELIYNDFNIAWENAKSDATYQLMQNLQANGIPVDGIGFQMHVSSDFDDYDSVRSNFERFAALGLNIHITEMDVSMQPGATMADQATVYREVLSICLEQPACKAFQLWGYTDRYSWLPDYDPLIFDRNYQAKPAYYELQDVLLGN